MRVTRVVHDFIELRGQGRRKSQYKIHSAIFMEILWNSEPIIAKCINLKAILQANSSKASFFLFTVETTLEPEK